MNLLIGVILISFTFFPSTSSADEIIGRVVKVVDGDTLDVQTESRKVRIRFHGIDCPEKDQPYGLKAKVIATTLASGKIVTIRKRGRGIGKFGRTIGDVILPDGKNMNQILVQAGACWWFKRYAPDDETLSDLEAEARAKIRGFWAEPNPMPPWKWRKERNKR